MTTAATPDQQALSGIGFAVAAFTWWGLAPIYFKAVGDVPALEVLSHRVIWSALLLGVGLALTQGWGALLSEFQSRRRLCFYLLTSLLLSGNWLVYIWAIQNDRVIESSLGYYINPMLSVVLGLLFLGERLDRLQWLAVALAVAGVANQLLVFGKAPWIALALAATFGLYGLLRKRAGLDPSRGLFVETVLMSPLALGLLVVLWSRGSHTMGQMGSGMDVLLVLAGPVTMLPLFLFLEAARRLPLSTIGILQYLGPTLQLLLAVFIYAEPFDRRQLVTFGLIWVGIARSIPSGAGGVSGMMPAPS